MQCGFIGLGMLGARMARQVLEAGHDLKVFDLDPAAGVATVQLLRWRPPIRSMS